VNKVFGIFLRDNKKELIYIYREGKIRISGAGYWREEEYYQ